ncbi:uncharacterized protein BJ171DRAFT_576326 [Polychytrium aggregatum]|uniref:uncharacterized protein n=1 Tax=Polychytrium aggregatum TaxID=110093 RepID=UPI0022FF2CFF|nr:uncharacterized protein BJ171DRAFT_576326 [Polychytrium aggregatum]KAI9209535.1 hypothetical protein BJ171DRAFT_576326 [Polychytrium aggregatum]
MSSSSPKAALSHAHSYLPLALLAGLCGALASVSAKLASLSSPTSSLVHSALCLAFNTAKACAQDGSEGLVYYIDLERALRLLSGASVLLWNALMWMSFTKALCLSSSSVQATVASTAANLCGSAVVGQILFRDSLSLQWWCGASLVVVGTMLMSHGQAKKLKSD